MARSYDPARVARIARRRHSIQVHTPAPVKGLNTVDPLTSMDPDYGLSIQNFIATPSGLSTRGGYRKWATGMPAAVTTLMSYHSGDTSPSKQFAVSGTAIYDITAPGAVGSPVVTGLSALDPYWQYTTQTSSTNYKHYMVAVNGADLPRMYDGTAWIACSQVASPSTPGQFKTTDNNGNAVNIQNFVDVLLHQQRLWFVNKGSTKAYYCDIAQAGGNLNLFDFGPVFPRGGVLHKLATWTIDTGGSSGTQALLVAMSNRGDVAIYLGNNPALATNWALSYTYQLGAPVGRRCTAQLSGDLMILTQDGLYPLSKYLQSSRVDSTAALTYTIAPTISELVGTLAAIPGFELIVYPGQNMMLLNVPQLSSADNFQFCFHTITKGWTQFTGIAASCWNMFNNSLYFGGNTGTVYLSSIGAYDAAEIDGTGGTAVVATAISAFNHFAEVPGLGYGTQKQVKAVKPYIISGTSNPLIKVGVNVDFDLTPFLGVTTAQPVAGGIWDGSVWDGATSTWAGALTALKQWAVVPSYPGEAIALAISISGAADITWAGTQWLIEPGTKMG